MKKSVLIALGSFFAVLMFTGCAKVPTVDKEVDNSGDKLVTPVVEEIYAEKSGDEEVDVKDNVASTEAVLEISAPVLTMEEVAKHAVKGDCWTVIGGNVYDLSDALAKHPGGAAQLEGCGIDSTELFETRPMGSGTPHSEQARGYLANYLLGPLTD